MSEPGYRVVKLDEIERRDAWIPIRDELGIRAFGINAYVARPDGRIISQHNETGSGQEELFVVLDGSATFTVDGEEIDAPAGTLVFVRDPSSVRAARGDATVLALGGKPGEAYNGFSWGEAWRFNRDSLAHYGEQRYAEAAQVVREGLAEFPDQPGLLYNLACFSALAGETDGVFEPLRRAVELYPPFREAAQADDDFASVRDDPRFAGALR